VTEWLAELSGRMRSDEVAIGVPDESLVPQLQRQFEQSGVRARWVKGTRIGESAPYRLLAVAVEFAGHRRYDDFARLVRHPDVEEWLRCPTPTATPSRPSEGSRAAISLPAQLDLYYNKHLPSKFVASRSLDNPRDWPTLAPALQRVDAWLEEASASRPLRGWGDVFRQMLDTVYGHRTLHLDRETDEVSHRTFRVILEECDRFAAVPEALDTLSLSAADAFQVALRPLADETLPPPAEAAAVEILGWLELPLDDSRALVVTSFNEGFVPQSAGADAFLPDRLRREMDLLHNERRYARDAYATSVLCNGREELRLIFGRRSANDDPLQPSRLLFTGTDEELMRRSRRFFASTMPPSAPRRLLLAGKNVMPDRSRFVVPKPVSRGGELKRISVTEFKYYLACPYRYYLRKVRMLEPMDDAARELAPFAFGNLLHSTLGAFGRDSDAPRDSEDKQEIIDFLDDRLSTLAENKYGSDRWRPSIRLQLDQARRRLEAFAANQAQLASEGWRIVYAEEEQGDPRSVEFVVDDSPIRLTGRMDRIDYLEPAKTIRIVDYKTADGAASPEKTHRESDGWIDLQLPLYRHMWSSVAEGLPVDCTVQLAYFNLPKAMDDAKIVVASWDAALLENADETARWVIRQIREQIFWPPANPPPKYSEDFATICLDDVLSGPSLSDGDEGGPE
jgi:ATP-dependent helicase/nuclease subunit B